MANGDDFSWLGDLYGGDIGALDVGNWLPEMNLDMGSLVDPSDLFGTNLGDIIGGGGDPSMSLFGGDDTTFYPDTNNLDEMLNAGINPGDDFWLDNGMGKEVTMSQLGDEMKPSWLQKLLGAAPSALGALGKMLGGGLSGGGGRGGGGTAVGVNAQEAATAPGLSIGDLGTVPGVSVGSLGTLPQMAATDLGTVPQESIPSLSVPAGASLPAMALPDMPGLSTPALPAVSTPQLPGFQPPPPLQVSTMAPVAQAPAFQPLMPMGGGGASGLGELLRGGGGSQMPQMSGLQRLLAERLG